MDLLGKKAVISFKINKQSYTILEDLYNIHILNTGNNNAYIRFECNKDSSGSVTDFLLVRDSLGNVINVNPDFVVLEPKVAYDLQETIRDFIPSATVTIDASNTTCNVVVVKRIVRE